MSGNVQMAMFMFAVGAAFTAIPLWLNIKRTNVFLGPVISLVQMVGLPLAVFVFLMVRGSQNGRQR